MTSTFLKFKSIRDILTHPTIVLTRQIEYANLIFNFETRNRYILSDTNGNSLGYLLERERSLGQMMIRQMTRLHRPFIVDLFDNQNNYLFKFQRGFSIVNSRVNVWNEIGQKDDYLVGGSIQKWHPWRRKYELFSRSQRNDRDLEQFGYIDAPILSYEFPVMNEKGHTVGGVDRHWGGLGQEMFTDIGTYVINFQNSETTRNDQVLNLNQRAVLLSNAISIDFDYFSRHSRDSHRGFLPFGIYTGGGGEEEGYDEGGYDD